VDDPAYVILVMVDEPRGNKATFGYATGGWVAAPVTARVVARMAPLLGLKPDFEGKGDDAERYWVDTEKKAPGSLAKVDRRYVRPASY
jgi:cell division protein FtsI (penicillin-binding protein 3)